MAGGLVASFRGDDDYCDISVDLGRPYWFIDGTISALRGVGAYHTDGFRYGAGAFDPDGDGDESALDLTLSILEPVYAPLMGLPPLSIMTAPPPPPVVTDEGTFTARSTGLFAGWSVTGWTGGGGPPVEFQHRVLGSTGLEPPFPVTTALTDWVSAGAATSADIPLALENGRTYFVEVKAESPKTEARVLISFSDTTPPPAPRLYVSTAGTCQVQWDPVFDSESGIHEYLVAVGSLLGSAEAPDIVPWTSLGRETSYANSDVADFRRIWVKVVNGAGLETVADYAKPLEGLTPPAPTAPIKVNLWGRDLAMDVPPQIEGGRVLVPMRALFEGLGATVNWDAVNRKVTGKREGRTVILTAGSKGASVGGDPVTLDVAATIIGGRVFVPLRFISEVLGADVTWDASTRTVRISMMP